MKEESILFEEGYQKEALKEAIKRVRKRGEGAELVICRDVPGKHTGGEDCFCGPRTIMIGPDGKIE